MDFVVRKLRLKFRFIRFMLFHKYFNSRRGKLLDLGGGDGSFLGRFKDKLANYDIWVADIDNNALAKAKGLGFKTIELNETLPFPFDDHEWDVVFCNSVIEHYTGPKQEILSIRKTKDFREIVYQHQKAFATEINRIGKSYFVQTPHRLFPIESHTHFPIVGYLNRSFQVEIISVLNLFWMKKTQPDWNLLTENDMRCLFPEAKIYMERLFGFPKSLIAIKL